MGEITESQKKQILKDLVIDEKIVMFYDTLNMCYRPLWKKEWDITQGLRSEKEKKDCIEKYNPHIATEKDIGEILENGDLEWENDGSTWYVKIWW